jgi:hypothetical protein
MKGRVNHPHSFDFAQDRLNPPPSRGRMDMATCGRPQGILKLKFTLWSI